MFDLYQASKQLVSLGIDGTIAQEAKLDLHGLNQTIQTTKTKMSEGCLVAFCQLEVVGVGV